MTLGHGIYGPAREGPDHEAYELAACAGEWPVVDLELRKPCEPPSFTEQLVGPTPKLTAPAIRAMRDSLLEAMDFKERYARSTIEHDLIGLLRRLPDGRIETLGHKLANEAKKGKHESAAFGLASVGETPVVLYAMDWDFFAGSFGAVSGEKFQMAADLAIRRELPLVTIYTSSGVRQHENYAGLIQMQRAVHALEQFKSHGERANIALLLGQVWGGISASVAPLADVVVGIEGTEYGFSGPNVIEAYEGVPVETGRQRVESHAVNRNVDVIVAGGSEALSYLDRLLQVTRPPTGRTRRFPSISPVETILDLDAARDSRIELLDRSGFVPPAVPVRRLREVDEAAASDPPSEDGLAVEGDRPRPTAEELYARYDRLVRSAARPDAEYFTGQVFADVVPLYNAHVVGDKLHYPAIIASLGRIDRQRFLVIGGQASYQRSMDGLRRIPASPAPADYEYLERMLDTGERLRLPAVFFTDTLGAKPTIAGEEQNQMLRIARAIARGIGYPLPVLTVVTGALGSGGGLTLGPNADWFAMLDDSLAFVAEARSAASILYKTAQPTRENVMDTLETMRATAWDQLDLELVDRVIQEDDDPLITAVNIRAALVAAYAELRPLSNRQLHQRRNRRLRNPGGLKVTRRH